LKLIVLEIEFTFYRAHTHANGGTCMYVFILGGVFFYSEGDKQLLLGTVFYIDFNIDFAARYAHLRRIYPHHRKCSFGKSLWLSQEFKHFNPFSV